MSYRQTVATQMLLLALVCATTVRALAQGPVDCPDIFPGQPGPYDYLDRDPGQARQVALVERVHFPPEVQNLIRGSTGTLGADLGFTIVAVPNHHRALDTISRLSVKLKTLHPPGLGCNVDAYFERAIHFRPKDPWVHLGYGLHLYRWNKLAQAEEQLLEAEKLAPDERNVLYNLGLLYADRKEWDKAMDYAGKAYAAGFSLPGLKKKLVNAGKWQEPRRTEPEPGPGPKGEQPEKAKQ